MLWKVHELHVCMRWDGVRETYRDAGITGKVILSLEVVQSTATLVLTISLQNCSRALSLGGSTPSGHTHNRVCLFGSVSLGTRCARHTETPLLSPGVCLLFRELDCEANWVEIVKLRHCKAHHVHSNGEVKLQIKLKFWITMNLWGEYFTEVRF